jgi:peptidoglycan/LPS O-acetylase OafA/YrhL
MDAVNPLGVAALALGAVLIGVGILLVIVGFVITTIVSTRPTPPGPAPAAGFWDFMVELAKRVQLIYVPGFIMIGLGVVLVAVVVTGADPFTSGAGTPSPSPSVLPSPAAT